MTNKVEVLIVDDTYEKTQIVASIVKEIEGCEIDICMSSMDAIRNMKYKKFDILIVDLCIPAALGEPLEINGGKDLIEYCYNSEGINRPTHIIGITSQGEAFRRYEQYFIEKGWPLLNEVEKKELVRSVVETKVAHSLPKPDKADIAFVTAIYKTELEAVLDLPLSWSEARYPNDNNTYYFGKLKLNTGDTKTVVATSCSRMGMSAAAATTMKICSKFSPNLLIMTGIAAGVEGKTNFGDILVADPCWDWGSGKKTVNNGVSQTLQAPHQITLSTNSRTLFQKISADRTYLDEINYGIPATERPGTNLSLHVGPVATGAVVLEDPETVKDIVRQHRETIGVEMEAYGFGYAVSIANNPNPNALILKSVCDFADPKKNDNWQKYAAYTSAQMAYKVLVNSYSDLV